MTTDFQKRKLMRQFKLLDSDGDGFITQADFDKVFQALVKSRGWSSESPQYTSLREGTQSSWEQLRQSADKDQDGRISAEEFMESRARLAASGPMDEQTNRALTSVTMAVFDSDGDGRITLADYTKVVEAHGDSADQAAAAFRKLDLNGDGVITPDELRQLVREFYTSDDPEAPGNWLYGELR